MKNKLFLLIFSFVVVILIGCNSTEVKCPGDSVSQLRIGFTRKTDTTSNHFTLYCPGLSAKTNDTLVTDTIFNENNPPVQLEIPVDITSDTMAIYMDFIDTTTFTKETDSIKLIYRKRSYLKDLECGIITEFLITSKKPIYSNNNIDTAFFTDNLLINSDKVNHVEVRY